MRDRTSIQPKRLRILIVVPYDLAEPGGGVKHHALGLANVLRGRGDTVVVAGPTSKPVREPHMVGFRGVVNVQFNGSANRIGIFVNPLSVRRFLRQNRFDIIHVQDPLAPGLPYWIAWLSESVPKNLYVPRVRRTAESCLARRTPTERTLGVVALPARAGRIPARRAPRAGRLASATFHHPEWCEHRRVHACAVRRCDPPGRFRTSPAPILLRTLKRRA